MTRVKVCGITKLEDALAALEAGADDARLQLLRAQPALRLARRRRAASSSVCRQSVECVGVFVNEAAPEEVERVAREAGVGAVQLHGDETPEFCRALRDLTTIKALRVGPGFDVGAAAGYPTDALLLDAYVAGEWGGTGHTFDWTLARRTREAVARLFLAGGLRPENVAAAVAAVRPYAVDVCSGVETSPGRKSSSLMHRFVEQVKSSRQ